MVKSKIAGTIRKDREGHILCPHGRRRHQCKACGGAGICEHKRRRCLCRDCGGASICEHKRQRNQCPHCWPLGAYKVVRRGAKRRGHLFDISFDDYQAIVCRSCVYCGAHDAINGIDQIIAGEGYTRANCVPCCSMCNIMKNSHSVVDFLQHIQRIGAFQARLLAISG